MCMNDEILLTLYFTWSKTNFCNEKLSRSTFNLIYYKITLQIKFLWNCEPEHEKIWCKMCKIMNLYDAVDARLMQEHHDQW